MIAKRRLPSRLRSHVRRPNNAGGTDRPIGYQRRDRRRITPAIPSLPKGADPAWKACHRDFPGRSARGADVHPATVTTPPWLPTTPFCVSKAEARSFTAALSVTARWVCRPVSPCQIVRGIRSLRDLGREVDKIQLRTTAAQKAPGRPSGERRRERTRARAEDKRRPSQKKRRK